MKMFKRRVRWAVQQAAVIGALYAAIHTGSPGWTRVGVFIVLLLVGLTWLIAALLTVAVFACPEEFKDEKLRDILINPVLPKIALAAMDVAVSLWLIYNGWIFTGCLWLSTRFTDWLLHTIIPGRLKRYDESSKAKEPEEFEDGEKTLVS